MSELQLVLLILAGFALLWQVGILVVGAAYARQGRSVTFGVAPGVVSLVLFIAAVFV